MHDTSLPQDPFAVAGADRCLAYLITRRYQAAGCLLEPLHPKTWFCLTQLNKRNGMAPADSSGVFQTLMSSQAGLHPLLSPELCTQQCGGAQRAARQSCWEPGPHAVTLHGCEPSGGLQPRADNTNTPTAFPHSVQHNREQRLWLRGEGEKGTA